MLENNSIHHRKHHHLNIPHHHSLDVGGENNVESVVITHNTVVIDPFQTDLDITATWQILNNFYGLLSTEIHPEFEYLNQQRIARRRENYGLRFSPSKSFLNLIFHLAYNLLPSNHQWNLARAYKRKTAADMFGDDGTENNNEVKLFTRETFLCGMGKSKEKRHEPLVEFASLCTTRVVPAFLWERRMLSENRSLPPFQVFALSLAQIHSKDFSWMGGMSARRLDWLDGKQTKSQKSCFVFHNMREELFHFSKMSSEKAFRNYLLSSFLKSWNEGKSVH